MLVKAGLAHVCNRRHVASMSEGSLSACAACSKGLNVVNHPERLPSCHCISYRLQQTLSYRTHHSPAPRQKGLAGGSRIIVVQNAATLTA